MNAGVGGIGGRGREEGREGSGGKEACTCYRLVSWVSSLEPQDIFRCKSRGDPHSTGTAHFVGTLSTPQPNTSSDMAAEGRVATAEQYWKRATCSGVQV